MASKKELPRLPVTLASLDAFALVLHLLSRPKAEVDAYWIDAGEAPELRAALEWCAARGLVVLSDPGWSTLSGAGVAKHFPAVGISFEVQLTDRGRALANLLPVVR
ncbi:MAG: hypothetical protein LW860_16355 [Xanthomonadaceae bacterium]|jgi:hypothetical protein|nr:hypothetical protein [Xanthomonadaceae bacterium]